MAGLTEFPPRVLSEEEIEMYLKGDRREVDRLVLFSLNRLAAALIPHAEQEERMLNEFTKLGGIDAIHARCEFIDELIARSKDRRKMMEKVSQSTLTWALIAFFGFLAMATWDSIVNAVKLRLGG